jgi:outer membrane protein assembly factor BamB
LSHSDHTNFTPAQVDEQIERSLSDPPNTPANHPSLRALHTFQRLYPVKSAEHAPSLERIWQGVLAASAQESAAPSTIIPAAATVDDPQDAPQSGMMSPASPHNPRRKPMPRARVLLLQLAAVLCLVLIVGSFVLVTTLSRQGQPASLPTGSGSGLYASLGSAIYRLDSQTHTILWKYTFASSETVEGGAIYDNGTQPVVVKGILYVETHTDTASSQQYLSALNTANGSLLWREPSARAFVNDLAVYTLVESKTANITTLTARDPRTGQQLWQRQYPIAGAAIDPARGTDTTEGFRIITLTDQLLYAVIWYRYNGQDIFARYGLSPKDGSIIWQDRDIISGRMPTVEARIVNGVIYTTEYNLRPVTPYVDSHGMTVNEMTQSRAAAYDAATGHLRWQTPEMVGEQPNGGFYIQVSSDMLSFQTYNQDWPAAASQPNSITTLHALSTSDGAPRWRYQWQGGSITGAALQGQSLYFETSQVPSTGNTQNLQVKIVALNAQTGTTRWTTLVKLLDGTEKTPTPPTHTVDPGFFSSFVVDMAPVASQDAIYYSTPGNKIDILQPSNGHLLTRFSVDKTPHTTIQDRVALFVIP